MSTKTPTSRTTQPATSASRPNPTEGANASRVLDAASTRTVYTSRPSAAAPMPIYLGAQNTPSASPLGPEGGRPLSSPAADARDARDASGAPDTRAAYNPLALLKALLALLGLLLGLTLALGGYRPDLSDALLGWTHGSISVVEGTDGDTGARPLDPHDEGVLPAPDTLPQMSSPLDTQAHPVEMGRTFFGDTSRLAPSVQPWSGPAEA